jgi:hypothetical protein
MSVSKEMNRDPVFHERINILKNEAYRGFTVISEKSKGPEIEVTVANLKGRTLSAGGETKDEAFKKLVDLIDVALDES